MAITNPQAVSFSNNFARRVADKYTELYYACLAFVNEWDANGIATLIPDDAAEVMADGSDADGRAPITGQNIHQLEGQLRSAIVGDLEANSKVKLNILLSIEVNGSPINL